MFDPNIHHTAQRKANQQAVTLRAKMFNQGQSLEGAVRKAKAKHVSMPTLETKDALVFALGKLSSYVALRESLCPTIGADMAMGTQKSLVKKISNELSLNRLPSH